MVLNFHFQWLVHSLLFFRMYYKTFPCFWPMHWNRLSAGGIVSHPSSSACCDLCDSVIPYPTASHTYPSVWRAHVVDGSCYFAVCGEWELSKYPVKLPGRHFSQIFYCQSLLRDFFPWNIWGEKKKSVLLLDQLSCSVGVGHRFKVFF